MMGNEGLQKDRVKRGRVGKDMMEMDGWLG